MDVLKINDDDDDDDEEEEEWSAPVGIYRGMSEIRKDCSTSKATVAI